MPNPAGSARNFTISKKPRALLAAAFLALGPGFVPTRAEQVDLATLRTRAEAGDPAKLAERTGFSEEDLALRENVVMALSAEAKLKSQAIIDSRDSARIALGVQYMRNTSDGCAQCHVFQDVGTDSPELTGWGSREWMVAFVSDPTHARFFGRDNDRMPSFGTEKSMTQKEIEMVVDWIRGEWYMPKRGVVQKH